MPKDTKPDTTTVQQDIQELISQLQDELVKCQDHTTTPHASKEEREAARYLYDQLVNYKGMIKKRKLERTIEFIPNASGPAFAVAGTGWYYQPLNTPRCAMNWVGPFPSHHLAAQDRIKNTPRTQFQHNLENALED